MICVGAAREGAGDREDGEEAEEGGGKEVEKDPGGDDVDERPLISAITIITRLLLLLLLGLWINIGDRYQWFCNNLSVRDIKTIDNP